MCYILSWLKLVSNFSSSYQPKGGRLSCRTTDCAQGDTGATYIHRHTSYLRDWDCVIAVENKVFLNPKKVPALNPIVFLSCALWEMKEETYISKNKYNKRLS